MQFNPPEATTTPEEVQSSAEDFRSIFWRITGQSDTLNLAFTKTSLTFSDILSETIRSAGAINHAHWSEACLACMVAADILEEWSEDLTWYKDKIKELRERLYNSSFATDTEEGQVLYNSFVQGLQEEAERHWETLEEKAEDCSEKLAKGTSAENVAELINNGRLGWLPYNLMGDEMPIPVDGDMGGKSGEELAEMIENGEIKEPEYSNIIFHLNLLNERAKEAQRRGERLSEQEMEYLESLYGELEKIDGGWDKENGGGVISIPDIIDGSFGDDEQASQLMEELGNGVLVLSDERLGGGNSKLPESVRVTAEGPLLQGPGTDLAFSTERWNYGEDLSNLARLLGSSSDSLEGGNQFSQNLSMSMGLLLNSVNNDDKYLEETVFNVVGAEGIDDIFNVATRNIEANHSLLTGQYENGNYYPEELEVAVRNAIKGILTFGDESNPASDIPSATGLFDWISEPHGFGSHPDADQLSAEALGGLVSIISHPDLHNDLMVRETGLFSGDSDEPSNLNAQSLEALTEIFSSNLFSFAHEDGPGGPGATELGFNEDLGIVHMPLEERTRFLEVLMTDEDTAGQIYKDTILFNQGQMMMSIETGDYSLYSNTAANLSGIVEAALTNEATYRDMNEEQIKEKKERIWNFASDAALGGVGEVTPSKYVPGVDAVGNLTSDLLKDHFISPIDPHELYADDGSLNRRALQDEMNVYFTDRLIQEWTENPDENNNPFFTSDGDVRTSATGSGGSERTTIEDLLREANVLKGNSEDPESVTFSSKEAREVLSGNSRTPSDEMSNTLVNLIRGNEITWHPSGVAPLDPELHAELYGNTYDDRKQEIFDEMKLDDGKPKDVIERRDREMKEKLES